jgi:Chromo (CHRromatin Organisation MOdifier) domain
MDLPKNGNFDSVLTIVDHDCTKAALFFPCNKSVDATGVAAIYAQQVFPHYGIPWKIISDRDPRFTANFAQAVCAQLNIRQNISMAYHPQTDGQSERANARLEQYLHIYRNAEQDNWVTLLPMAQYVHNSWINTSTGYTPFDLLIGHTPTANVFTDVTNVPEVARQKEWLEQARQRAQAVIRNAQQLIQQCGQRKKGQRHYHGHAVGSKVWLEGANLKLTHPKAKLDAKRYGPFSITKEISPVVFQLALPPQWRIHNVFHASLLTPYKETEEHGENFVQPPPELIEGQEEYEVEQIINSRQWGRAWKLQYLLRWKGYSHAHDSWQDATEVHTPKLIREYYARKKNAVRAIDVKGGDQFSTNTSPSLCINRITMSNGSLSPASTFSFIYPTTDHEETPTARTTNDHQYDDQVVLFGAGRQQSVGADPSLVDFDPLGVDIMLCDAWYQPEAVYCNNTWWATLQDDGSEASESGSSDAPS